MAVKCSDIYILYNIRVYNECLLCWLNVKAAAEASECGDAVSTLGDFSDHYCLNISIYRCKLSNKTSYPQMRGVRKGHSQISKKLR